MMIRAGAALILLVHSPLLAGPISRKKVSGPAAATSGTYLMRVWKVARKKFHDANFISVSGRTRRNGLPRCNPSAPFQNGWRYTFYSKSKNKFLMMAACRGKIAGPLIMMQGKGASTYSIKGKFIDSDVALRTLKGAGVSLDPFDHKAGGKRPFTLKLYRVEDVRFATHPTVWKIKIGNKAWLIDAVHREMFSAKRYGVRYDVSVSTDSAYAASILALRPKRKNIYTALTDLERAMEYARNQYPGSSLMAIDGFVDAWGGTPCTGPGDGWAYYFYYPRSRGYEVIYACNGYIGPGPVKYVPVDFNQHKAIEGRYLDSGKILDSLLVHHPSVFNEGLGRSFKRHGSALLRNFRASPFSATDMWNVHLIWQISIGRTVFRFNAKTAKLIDVTEK